VTAAGSSQSRRRAEARSRIGPTRRMLRQGCSSGSAFGGSAGLLLVGWRERQAHLLRDQAATHCEAKGLWWLQGLLPGGGLPCPSQSPLRSSHQISLEDGPSSRQRQRLNRKIRPRPFASPSRAWSYVLNQDIRCGDDGPRCRASLLAGTRALRPRWPTALFRDGELSLARAAGSPKMDHLRLHLTPSLAAGIPVGIRLTEAKPNAAP